MTGCAPMSSGRLDACHFCHRNEEDTAAGKLLKQDDVVAHVKCMQFSPQVVTTESLNEDVLGGFDIESVKNEIKRGARVRCTNCGETGGTIGCDVRSCKKTFHYLCITAENGKCVEDSKTEKYLAYCKLHKPKSGNRNDLEQEDDTDNADSTHTQNDKRPTPAKTKRKKNSQNQKTASPRAKKRKGTHSKKALQSRTTIQLNENDHSEEDTQSSPQQSSTASDETSPSGISRSESSETDDDLPAFIGSNITPNKKKRKNVSTPKLHSSDRIRVDENADSNQSDASEQSVSLLNPLPKLLHSTSLSKTWKENATSDERQNLDSVTPEETIVYGNMYEELGGSLPQNMEELSEADIIGNDGGLNMDDASSPLERPVSESSISSQPTSTAQNANSTTGKERMEPESTNSANATPTPLGNPTNSVTKSDVHNKVKPLMNKSPLLDQKIQQRFRNIIPKIQSLANKGKSLSYPEKEVQVTAEQSSSQSKIANRAEKPEEEDSLGMANIDVSTSSSTQTTAGLGQLTREYKEMCTQTDAAQVIRENTDCSTQTNPAYPETDVLSINFSSSENADLFTQYKTVKELMYRPGVESSESGQCKKFWDMCHEKESLTLYLKNIKCSLNLITENILKGAAAEHEYEQAFRFLMGSRYVEGLALKEREVIQQRISHIEDEKLLLSRNLTMLDDLLM